MAKKGNIELLKTCEKVYFPVSHKISKLTVLVEHEKIYTRVITTLHGIGLLGWLEYLKFLYLSTIPKAEYRPDL